MAEQAIRWKDSRGILHETEEAADEASRQYDFGDRRRAVLAGFGELLAETTPAECRRGAEPFTRDRDAAEWLIQNWPAIKAIGFAYRLDDLAPPAKE